MKSRATELLEQLHDHFADRARSLDRLAAEAGDGSPEAHRLDTKAEGLRLGQSYVFDMLRQEREADAMRAEAIERGTR